MRNEKIKVIVVDDHPIMAQATKQLLEQIEHIEVVDIAHNGKRCMELVELHQPNMVFLDYQLTDQVGTEVAEQIKNKYPQIHIVIFTGVDISDLIDVFLELQVSGVISKGTRHSAIQHMVACILDNHLVLSRDLLHKTKFSSRTVHPQVPLLTDDEVLIMTMIVNGATLEQIALKIHSSKRSVDNYQRKIYNKLGVKTRAQAIGLFIQSNYYTV